MEGKCRSRFNGLKHGLTAKVPVLPGEDPAAFRARVDSMTVSLCPQNQLEADLLERVAATTWSLDRATRAEAARLTYLIRHDAVEREQREQEEAAALGQRLLWDARGPWQLYPHCPHSGLSHERRVSWSEDPADPNNPALLVLRLERTVAGCRWLLARWAELRARLEPAELWSASDQFKAIRLLGRQPLDAIDNEDVLQICLASARLLPDGDDAKAFALIKSEIRKRALGDGIDEHIIYSRELKKRALSRLTPPDAAAAREVLKAIVHRHTARLNLILAHNQEIAEADAALAPDRLAFDPSPDGEKLRRYALSAARLVNQTIKTFLSVVREPLSVEEPSEVLCPSAAQELASATAFVRTEPNEPRTEPEAQPAFNPEPSATAFVRTEPNADSSLVPGPLSVVKDGCSGRAESSDVPGSGGPTPTSADGRTPTSRSEARAAMRDSLNNGQRTTDNGQSAESLGGVPRTEPNEPRTEPEVPPTFDPEPSATEFVRTEPNGDRGRSRPPDSIVSHPSAASDPAPAPTVAAAARPGPYDALDRRYFGAQMTAARAACAGTQRTSGANQHRAGPRKPTTSKQQN